MILRQQAIVEALATRLVREGVEHRFTVAEMSAWQAWLILITGSFLCASTLRSQQQPSRAAQPWRAEIKPVFSGAEDPFLSALLRLATKMVLNKGNAEMWKWFLGRITHATVPWSACVAEAEVTILHDLHCRGPRSLLRLFSC